MQVVQGLTTEPARAFREAVGVADRALDLDPNSSLAMAIKGHAMCHLGHDVDGSRRLLQEATHSNPNDAMAWLYRSVWSTRWGSGEDSIEEAENALRLSPLDPQRFFIEMLVAHSYLHAHQLDKAIAALKQDGTLSKLSQKWIGADISQ